MKLTPSNFLTFIKQIVTGGGRHTDGSPFNDAGFLADVAVPLSALSTQSAVTDSTGGSVSTTFAAITAPAANATTSLTADMVAVKNALASIASLLNARNLEASETNLLVQQFAASTTAAGSFSIVIPRDYDKATDVFQLKVGAAMAGATDVPALTATIYRKRPGANIATVATVVSTTALSATEQVITFDASGHSLQRDDALTIVLTVAAHTTDALNIYFVEPVYRSTLVSYDETDGLTSRTGTSLR